MCPLLPSGAVLGLGLFGVIGVPGLDVACSPCASPLGHLFSGVRESRAARLLVGFQGKMPLVVLDITTIRVPPSMLAPTGEEGGREAATQPRMSMTL